MKIKNKKAAMEMTMGTIVTIVLLVSVLVLGLVLVRSIFSSATNAVDLTDQQLQNEIQKLFADGDKKVVIYPNTKMIEIKQGEEGGFAFSIRNTESKDGVFSYKLSVGEIPSGCDLTEEEADELIILGKEGDNINIPSGRSMDEPKRINIQSEDTTNLCTIRYSLDIEKDGEIYVSTIDLDVKIV